MNRTEITNKLLENHQSFIDYVSKLDDAKFMQSPAGKWTAGQQLEHIYLSVKPLSTGFILPKIVIKLVFGKANRPSKSYQDLVKKYHDKLDNGGKASGSFVPKAVDISQKKNIANSLSQVCKNTYISFTGFFGARPRQSNNPTSLIRQAHHA